MRYGKFLKENGTIGFVAPSFGCATEPYRTGFGKALLKFDDMGYRSALGPNVYMGCGVGISNTPDKCGEELTDFYLRKDNDVLISCGGGELMCETLDYIDFEAIKKAEPKWYMGYSDNTNFTFLSATLCDTAAIYGPCASTFGMDGWHESLQDAFDLLTGKKLVFNGYDKWELESLRSEENPTPKYNTTENANIVITKNNKEIQEAEMEGRLIGGCLDILVMLCGTKYDRVSDFLEKYKDDGFIWFIEACDLNMLSIRRALWQLKEASWFKYCKGFMIGRPLHYDEEIMGVNRYNAVTEALKEFNVPIIMDMDIGHLAPMVPLVVGSMAKVVAKDKKYSIEMQLV